MEELEYEGEISKDFLSFVHAQVGFLLLFDLHFEEAVNHFLLSETMQPSEVFPFIMRDPNRWSLLVLLFLCISVHFIFCKFCCSWFIIMRCKYGSKFLFLTNNVVANLIV